MATRVYRNDNKKPVNLLGIGEVLPGEQISVTSDFLPPINLANYPGVVDVLAEEGAQNE